MMGLQGLMSVVFLGIFSTGTAQLLGCPSKSDIIFLIDGSSSQAEEVFRKELSFVADVAESFHFGEDGMQFAAVAYGYEVEKQFDFKDISSKDELRPKIMAVMKSDTSTYTHAALDFVREDAMFSEGSGARPSTTKIVVIVTDGKSSYPRPSLIAAQKLKNDGVHILTVGVSENVDVSHIRLLASSPEHAFIVRDFDKLDETVTELVARICEVAS